MSEKPLYETVNYLFAAYLQTREGGSHKIEKVEKLRVGRAKFFFRLTDEEVQKLQFQFHQSSCAEFEQKRRSTIDLAY